MSNDYYDLVEHGSTHVSGLSSPVQSALIVLGILIYVWLKTYSVLGTLILFSRFVFVSTPTGQRQTKDNNAYTQIRLLLVC